MTADQDRGRAADDVLARIEASSDPRRELFLVAYEALALEQPELAEVVRLAAIPRSVDAETLRLLLDDAIPAALGDEREVLARLARLSFVTTSRDGSASIDAVGREWLLEEWREPHRIEELRWRSEALSRHYQDRYRRARSFEVDLVEVRSLLRETSPTRYRQLLRHVETLLAGPLVDALHHCTTYSPAAAYELFVTYVVENEATGRLGLCHTLLQEFSEGVAGAPEASRYEVWIDYWKARLERQAHDDREQAEAHLLDLLGRAGDDKVLRAWILADLVLLYQDMDKLKEAMAACLEELALSDEAGLDPFNAPTSMQRLGSLQWTLQLLEDAARSYRAAVDRAVRQRNVVSQAFALSDLSGLLGRLGRREEALAAALEGLHIVRTELRHHPAYRWIAWRLVELLALPDPGLAGAIFAETALSSGPEASQEMLRLRRWHVDLHRRCGQHELAEERLAELEADSAGQDEEFVANLLVTKAGLRATQGREHEAVDLLSQILDEGRRVPGLLGVEARIDRGCALTALGRPKEAERDLSEAAAQAERMGHDILAAVSRTWLADAKRAGGDLAGARDALAGASSLADQSSDRSASYHTVRGRVLNAAGQYHEAGEAFRRALAVDRRLELHESAGRDLMELARVAWHQGRWDDGVASCREAAAAWEPLARAGRYRPSTEEAWAAHENALGVQRFGDTSDAQAEELHAARMHFRAAAARTPDNPWYWLNLSYACAAAEDWNDASRAVRAALDQGRERLPRSFLDARLAEYRMQVAITRVGSGDSKGAARELEALSREFEGRLAAPLEADLRLTLGDVLMLLGRAEPAESAFRAAAAIAATADDAGLRAFLHIRLAFTAAVRSDLDTACDELAEMLRWASQTPHLTMADIVGVCSPLITAAEQYHQLALAIEEFFARGLGDVAARRNLTSAAVGLSRDHYRQTVRPRDGGLVSPDVDVPWTSPIVLRADVRLFPEDQASPRVDRLFRYDIPRLREEFRSATAVTLPAILIGTSIGDVRGRYEIFVNGVPVRRGTVVPGRWLCADLAGCERLGLRGAVRNVGAAEVWLDEDNATRATAGGLVVLDPYTVMVDALRDVILAELPALVGMQQLRVLLDDWAQGDPERQSLVASAVAQQGMARLLELVTDQLRKGQPGNIGSVLAMARPA